MMQTSDRPRNGVLGTVALLIAALASTGASAEESYHRFRLEKGDHVVFLGGTFADQLRRDGYLETLLTAHYPQHEQTFRNLGWSGDTLTLQPRPLNFGSQDEHLAEQGADVIFACFGMAESFEGPEGLDKFESDWQRFIEHAGKQNYNGESPPRLVMISPIAHERLPGPLPEPEEHNRSLAEYTRRMAAVAKRHGIPFVDLITPTRAMMQSEHPQRLTHNGVHLTPYGYWAVSRLIFRSLVPEAKPWRVEIDFAREMVKARGTRASGLERKEDGLSLVVSDQRLPGPPAPEGARPHAAVVDRQARLVVKGLPPGTYELKADGEVVAKAGHRDWAAGVALVASPGVRRAEELRSAIRDKNRHFFYRWRAHNSEYIFGRRAKPFGVVTFPPEMAKLDELIAEKERKAWSLADPGPSQSWELVRIGE